MTAVIPWAISLMAFTVLGIVLWDCRRLTRDLEAWRSDLRHWERELRDLEDGRARRVAERRHETGAA